MRNKSLTPIEKSRITERLFSRSNFSSFTSFVSLRPLNTEAEQILSHKLQGAQMGKNPSHSRGNGMISKEFQPPSISHEYLSLLQLWDAAKCLLSGMQRGRGKLLPSILSIPKGPIQTFPLTLPKMRLNFEPRGCYFTNTLHKEWHEKYFGATGNLLENYIKSRYNLARSLNLATYTQGTMRAAAINLKKNNSFSAFFWTILATVKNQHPNL